MIATVKVHDLVKGKDQVTGAAILVDRLWPRGIAKQDLHYDYWFKGVAPSPELRKWWGHDPDTFAEFARRYRAELDAADAAGSAELEQLQQLADAASLTLLFAARDRAINHAVVLREWLQGNAARLGK